MSLRCRVLVGFVRLLRFGVMWRTLGVWQRMRGSRETAYWFALGWDRRARGRARGWISSPHQYSYTVTRGLQL